MVMTAKSVENGRNNKTGQFAKGNKIGKMKKKGFTLTDLNKVVVAYEKAHEVTILKHYVEQLLEDNRLLDKYIDRNVPVKTINELTGVDGSPLTFIVEKSYEGEDGKPKDNQSKTKP